MHAVQCGEEGQVLSDFCFVGELRVDVLVMVAHVPRAPEYRFAMFAGMVIEDSGAYSPWFFEKIPVTGNLKPLRKVTAGSLRLLMPRNLDTFHLQPLVLRQGSCHTPDLTPNGGCSRSTNPQ